MKKYIILITTIIFSSCCSLSGSRNLGKNIFLLEGDRIEDRIIVYCTAKEKGCCQSGSYIIPREYGEHFENGKYAQYVEKAESNGKWIIAQTKHLKSSNENYWIIEKNFDSKNSYQEVNEYVFGPFTLEEFLNKKEELKIRVDF